MKYLFLALVLFVSGCGYTSRDNEMIGQVKKVNKNTPLLCFDFLDADVSLGVLRNGVGSMSSEDVWIYIPDKSNYEKLKAANESGALVKITYDVKRVTWCVEDHIVTNVEVIK